MGCTPHLPGHRRGFTLMELLVVITIIAALIAMLLPAIKMVRNQARLSQCRSNMRICTLAVEAYTQDNEGFMPYSETGGGGWWVHRTSPYLDNTYSSSLYKRDNIYHCAFAISEIPNQWRSFDRFSFDFGMNGNVYASWNPAVAPVTGWNGPPPRHQSQIRSATVMLSDGHISYSGGFGNYFYDAFSIMFKPWPLEGSTALPWTVAPTNPRILLHAGVLNQSHMDGHVSSVVGTFNVATQTAAYTP